MEQSSQMSAEQSLKLINETLRDSRLVITKRSGSHFILWGAILTLIALAVYFLWRSSGNPAWNLLWFAMPAIGVSARCGTGQGRRMCPVQSDQQSPWLDMGSVRSVCRDSQSLCVAVCPDEPDLGHYPPFRLCGEHLGDDPQKPADCHRRISHRCPWCHSGSETLR